LKAKPETFVPVVRQNFEIKMVMTPGFSFIMLLD
jgi:hypothetical protein